MRIAVALPSLEAGAPQRRSIDAMLEQLVGSGHEVEGFAEHDRSDEKGAHPVFHYLRMPERHADRPFDTALYPLGRDATPYQSVFFLMNLYPGAVWFLDPTVHHLAVGGIALMDDWASYRELLDRAYGPTGAAVAQTVASNWGTGALFRRYDLVAAAAASQPAVLAAWPSLAARIASRLEGITVKVVPLALVDSLADPDTDQAAASVDGGVGDIAIMTVNESYATTAVRVAAAALEAAPDARVRLCLSDPIYRGEGAKVARHLGINERIEWELATSAGRLAEVAAASGVLLWLAEELEGGHRMLLLKGLAAGKLTFVPRCSLYDDLPEGAVAKIDLGRTAGPTFAAMLGALSEDAGLRDGLAANGRAFAATCSDSGEASSMLATELEKLAAAGPLREAPVSRPTWQAVARRMNDAAMPGGASTDAESLVAGVLGAHTEP